MMCVCLYVLYPSKSESQRLLPQQCETYLNNGPKYRQEHNMQMKKDNAQMEEMYTIQTNTYKWCTRLDKH